MKKQLLSVIFLLIISSWVHAQITPSVDNILYVNKTVTGGTQSGNSWTNAIPELRDALQWADLNWDDSSGILQIWTAEGEYKPVSPADPNNVAQIEREATFKLVNSVEVYGGFIGNETNSNQRDWEANTTVLSGDIDNNDTKDTNGVVANFTDISGSNSYSVVTGSNTNSTAILDGVFITAGHANLIEGSVLDPNVSGAGIFINAGNPSLTNLYISGNRASYYGGGVFTNISSPVFTNITITGNKADEDGGGINIYFGNDVTEFTNTRIYNNTADNDGGGLYGLSSVSILNTSISGNTAHNGAGAYFFSNDTHELTNVTFSNNTAIGNGGAIYTELFASISINNSIIWGNSAADGNEIYNDEIGPGSANLNYCIYGDAPGDIAGSLDEITINNSFTTNPQFVDSANGDYSLQSPSPAINAGENTLYTNVGGNLQNDLDLGENPRLFQNTIDIGAFESQTAQLNPNPENIIFVDKNIAINDGNGDSWINATPELADALDYAKQNESNWTTSNPLKIYVAKGSYTPTNAGGSPNIRNKTFLMVKNVKLYGGFDPTNEIVALTDSRIFDAGTILSGDIDGDGSSTGNAYHVVVAANNLESALINGFTITGGNADISQAMNLFGTQLFGESGGGVYSVSSSLLIMNTQISGNNGLTGGGVFNNNSSPKLINTTIIDNTVLDLGGGMYNIGGSSPVLINTTISENFSNNNGGGIYNEFSAIELNNSILWNNTATNDGNEVYLNETSFSTSSIRLDYSIYGNGPNDISDTSGTGVTATNSLTNTPQFTDPANGDFSLLDASPAINAGNNTLYTSGGGLQNDLDLAGNPRLSDLVIDMGAFETQALSILPNADNVLFVNKNVNVSDPSYSGVGDSWENALPELADALVFAKENEGLWTKADPLQIWVAGGTYNPLYSPADDNFGNPAGRDNAFLMVNNVQLYGGFEGNEAATEGRDLNNTANATMLSGDIDNNDILISPTPDAGNIYTETSIANNAYHVVVSSGDLGDAALNGFTLKGGKANGTGNISINGNTILTFNGGGIYNSYSFPSLSNVTISGNTASRGGGMYNENSSSPSLSNVTISRNTANNGGGMINSNSSPSLTNVTISGNTASSGGGMFNSNSSPSFSNVTISGNTVNNNGGGMFNSNSSPSLTNSILWGNMATNGTDGISDNFGSSTSISFSLVQDIDNTANDGLDGTDNANTPQFTNAANGDYSLQNTSPAVNAGDNTAYTNAGGDLNNDTDLAGNPRVFDGNPDPDIIDLGVFELQAEPFALMPNADNILFVNKNVNTSAAGYTGVGDSWDNAALELADALVFAKNNEGSWTTRPLQIWVAGGTYKPLYSPGYNNFGNEADRDNSFLMVNNVQLYGGFSGDEMTFADRDLSLTENSTTLSGDINDNDIITGSGSSLNIANNGENVYHVIISSGPVGMALLDGLTITGGNADGSDFLFVNLDFIVKNFGGGIYNNKAELMLTNLTLIANNASAAGGIYNFFSSSTSLTNVTIRKNTAVDGGGLYNSNSSPSLSNCSFIENSVTNVGGGFFNTNSSPQLNNCSFIENSAGSGGGMSNFTSSSPELINCSFIENTTTVDGGGMSNINSSPILTNCSFAGNFGNSIGDGISNFISFPQIANSIVWGGISNDDSASGFTASYSLIEGSSDTNNGNVDADGITETDIFTDPANGEYTLLPDSPAVGAGRNDLYTAAGGDLSNDLDLGGNPRLQATNIDIGAYEAVDTVPTAVCTDFTAQLDADGNVTILASDVDGGSSDAETDITLSLDTDTFTCSDVGDNTVTLTVEDETGNVATCTATVTVVDSVPPVVACVADATRIAEDGLCSYTVQGAEFDATFTDSCGGTLTNDFNGTDTLDGAVLPVGDNTVVWTADDGNGNTAMCSVTITVVDDQAPVVACAAPIRVQLGLGGSVSITPADLDFGSTDNCSVSLSLSQNTFTCADLGVNLVTLTATDPSGNSTSCNTFVTVEDDVAPVAQCVAPITLQLDENGLASITAADIDDGSTDACGMGMANITLDQTDFTCADIGDNMVTMTIMDAAGNSDSCTTTVTIIDNSAPVLTCPANQTVQADANGEYVFPDYFATGEATADDNCTGTPTTTQIPEPGRILPVGNYTVRLTTEDANGNTADCSFEVVVETSLGLDGFGASSISLYPNPVQDALTIDNPDGITLDRATVYDMTGRVVSTTDLRKAGRRQTIDLSELASATYIVVVTGEGGALTKQIVKE